MLIGEYQHTIDTKKRLAIPAKFRKDLGEQAIVTKGLENCLVIYTLVEWEKQAKKLEALPPTQIDARNYARLMLSGAADAVLDKLGRILVPDYLKNYAGLKKNVAVLGLSNRIEVWDADKWAEYRKKTETTVSDIAERLKEFGV
ncbi:MAG: Protein MraZ [Candidatus Roizmanbacteria bacterium GW2011_GWC2_41_7]|uniref:Transcriptional regulator MraZ n=3 Tax=Patescibacteria group TaxID=1783273 RepID=A0A0G0X306_9BACT|nr:MAG: Protein MraZ [Candidatus Roizmanbacteria bacterium GW2011_GWC2_41_7]KKT17303.1 MAG: Protein MraZ [Parcubacteria group bacterium GW2011_GWB1_43_6]OGZ20646.1 MAG: cell division/cell wall cluster transcriptional repressor MraZ [Candidatus Nealsonbacteria bacterium RIFCSPHIGHO2_01_FULL_43_31]OGZ21730.1 MAG: cell division/cell wall cluster transcriptional repressor MraZ [Candidatus Nealsonbacteria bacterium RIFCSPHIGHO2_02_FULL_43_13]OGZ25221.1 MAG: cell division/cell wall cluster transcript